MYFITRKAVARYENEDFPADEIRKTLLDGYQYVNSVLGIGNDENRVHLFHRSTYDPNTLNISDTKDSDLYEKSEEIRACAPLFPDEIFDGLPRILQQGITAAQNPQQRNMLLMGMFSILSWCIPRASVVFA